MCKTERSEKEKKKVSMPVLAYLTHAATIFSQGQFDLI